MENAAELMKKDVICIDRNATFNEAFTLIDNHNFTSYPVVSSKGSYLYSSISNYNCNIDRGDDDRIDGVVWSDFTKIVS